MRRHTLPTWLRAFGPLGMGRPRRYPATLTEALGRELAAERRRRPFRQRFARRRQAEFRRRCSRWLVLGISERRGR